MVEPAMKAPFEYTEVAEPMFPWTKRSFPESWKRLLVTEPVVKPMRTSRFWFWPKMRRLEDADTPEREKNTGDPVAFVPPITISVVEVLFRMRSVGASYAKLRSWMVPALA
jgi:hypothetical protein